MKRVQKNKAVELRKNGESIKGIAKLLEVSPGSVSRWTRDIILTDEQRKKLNERMETNWLSINSQKNNQKRGQIYRERRESYQKEGRKKANENNLLHAMGCMLYWAEGFKKNNKHTVKISNSDPYLIKMFLTFLRECYEIKNEEIAVSLNLYTDIVSVEGALKFWQGHLKLPRECFKKSIVNNLSRYTQQKRCGLLKYGTCALLVHNTELLQKIYGAIQEYGKFDREAWLMGTDDRIV